MAMRLNDLVEAGELFNNRWYSTHGWLKLRGREDVLVLELTGNCCRDLQGWHIRFEGKPIPTDRPQMVERTTDEEAEQLYRSLQWRQIGVTGDLTADRKVKWCDCSLDEFIERSKAGDPPPHVWKPLLYLEWYSQNGRVVVELLDADIEFVKQENFGVGISLPRDPPAPGPEEPEAEAPGLGITEIRLDERGEPEFTEHHFSADDITPAPADDPYDLFKDTPAGKAKAEKDAEHREFMRELEFYDELIDSKDPGLALTDYALRGMKFPDPDSLTEEEAEVKLKSALGALALYNVALHVCEHCTPREAYRIFVTQMLPEASGHPDLRGTGWAQHYMTSDWCPTCQAEFEP